jgi:hypothetical protein
MESRFNAMVIAPPAETDCAESPCPPRQDTHPAPKRILVVSRTGRVDADLMDQTLNIAQRLGLDLLCLYIDPMPQWSDADNRRPGFATNARTNASLFVDKARRRGVNIDALFTSGKVLETVGDIVARNRGIEFVVVEPGIGSRELTAILSVPVFAAVVDPTLSPQPPAFNPAELFVRPRGVWAAGLKFLTEHPHRGGKQMASTVSKRKTVQKTFVFGAAAAAIYAAVYFFADPLMAIATKGKFYAVVPVATVFLFSYIHGNFTSYFWSALGIEASKSVGVQPTAKAVKPAKRKDTRPRARLSV